MLDHGYLHSQLCSAKLGNGAGAIICWAPSNHPIAGYVLVRHPGGNFKLLSCLSMLRPMVSIHRLKTYYIYSYFNWCYLFIDCSRIVCITPLFGDVHVKLSNL